MLRWKLGVTLEASTVGRSAMRRRPLSTSRLSQPAWHVTRMARSPWRIESDGVRSAWAGQRHIAVLPDQVPPSRATRVRRSGVGILATWGIIAHFAPSPLPPSRILCLVLAKWAVDVGSYESVSDLPKNQFKNAAACSGRILDSKGFRFTGLKDTLFQVFMGVWLTLWGSLPDLVGAIA